MEEKRASLLLFKYVCQQITGDKKVVKTKRLLNSVIDRVSSDEIYTYITSGSLGEGLELKGSDIDIMQVFRELNVSINPHDLENFDTNKLNFCTEMGNAKPGFSFLRYIGSLNVNNICTRIDGDYYLSSEIMKNSVIRFCETIKRNRNIFNEIHGPCITDKFGRMDLAYCLHLRKWIYCASGWIKRASTWPDFESRRTIVEHGMLFVPIGNTGSNYVDIYWRISFSVAERILITSFSHTHLVCYALCKILLKDVIEKDEKCRGLLCSYHLKTIIFWISEEETLALWRPENLITCFLKCLQRLIYCVQIGSCPHYFLPEVNLFNKIGKEEQISLLENLNILLSHGWRCLLKSEQLLGVNVLSTVATIDNNMNNEACYVDYFSRLICSKTFIICRNTVFDSNCCKTMHYLRRCMLNRIKQLYVYSLSTSYKGRSGAINFIKVKGNKMYFTKYKLLISYILQSLSLDAVSGWIALASFFQKIKHFHQALHILSYIVTKFTSDKIYKTVHIPTVITDSHTKWMLSKTMQQKGIMHAIKTKCIEPLTFSENVLPEEIKGLLVPITKYSIIRFPPLVFTHFLRILCQTKLNNYTEARNTLKDLESTSVKKSFICGSNDETMFVCLHHICLRLLGYKLGYKLQLGTGQYE